MQLRNTYNGIILAGSYATLCIGIVTTVIVYAGYMLANHWVYIAEPCIECVASFKSHMLAPSHLLPLALLSWATYAIVRAVHYIKKEYNMHSQYNSNVTANNTIHLVHNAPLAAWSSGLIHSKMYADTAFWNTLSANEQVALLAHEQHHISNLEVLQFFLIGLAHAIMPVPLIQAKLANVLATVQYNSEVAADKSAIQRTSRKTLASLLFKAIVFETGTSYTTAPGINNLLQSRIECITKNDSTYRSTLHKDQLILVTLMTITCSGLLSVYILVKPLQSCLV